ncbi:ubiquinone biosynthesis O-methyltransferase [Anabaenopsis circularis NIES-21]|uniref:Ubiquinone biosynthesis O-methyltransferase n=1 Tax=Anabaenopsis circularis NIES-21 TaxID=1085406 RepID=A0A1Z4GHR9_9CYAN|nr:ubiquinone biosynthesis O-methyltransferase [Anabaenopsis circularis NIES-21]
MNSNNLLVRKSKRLIQKIADIPFAIFYPEKYKDYRELSYWQATLEKEGQLGNEHYSYFYTAYFDLEPSFYASKRVLDIGCGPRGSLEWADSASERIGLDPLADEYLKLGADKHKMSYVAAPSEKIPFADEYFDVVCSFNSLDHVTDYQATASEIKRVAKPGGLFLMIVEVNHPPRPHEPISLSWQTTDDFLDVFDVTSVRRYEIGNHDIYGQLLKDDRFDDTKKKKRPGILTAKFVKRVEKLFV